MRLKKIIKRMMSSMYYTLQNSAVLGSAQNDGFRILLYHSVNLTDSSDRLGIRMSPEKFLQQMQYLHEAGYTVGDLADLIQSVQKGLALAEKTIAITFDDGYKDVLENALPILRKFGFSATVFIAPAYTNGMPLARNCYWESWPFLSWPDLKILQKEGLKIGAHSFSHQPLAALTEEQLQRETKTAKDTIEQALGSEVKLFSYPHGSVNPTIKETVKSAGYAAACASMAGRNSYQDDIFELKRTEIEAADSLFEFKKKLSGSYDWVSYFKANRGK
ncbi:MAG: polysaccharide deacetylase family protein [Candidatus Omnitrophota bacterium]